MLARWLMEQRGTPARASKATRPYATSNGDRSPAPDAGANGASRVRNFRDQRVRRPIFAPARERQPTTSRSRPLSRPLSASNSTSPGSPECARTRAARKALKPRHHTTATLPDPLRPRPSPQPAISASPPPITKALRLSSLIFFKTQGMERISEQTHRCNQ